MAWLRLASSPSVRVRAFKTACLVGAALILINHGAALVAGDVDAVRLVRILLTVAVPYLVSTHASASALRGMR